MKKLLLILVALLLFCTTASAATWTQNDVVSPYSVQIIPVRVSTNFFGQQTYTPLDFCDAKTGDNISFAVQVNIPENAQAATLTVKPVNAVLNCATSASLPTSQGVYYLSASGSMQSTFAVLGGYCTGVPTINAYIRGNTTVNSVGMLKITTDSNGFIFTDNGRGMEFYPDASGKVYTAYVFGLDYRYKITHEIVAGDTEAGSVARYVLKTLGMESSDLLAGNVFMSKNVLAKNFGVLADTETSKSWVVQTTPQAAITLPVSTVAEVPATGFEADVIQISCTLVILGVAWLIYDMIRKDKKRER